MGNVVLEPITPELVVQANKRGAETIDKPTAVVHADIEQSDGTLFLRLVFRDGARVSLPTSRIEELDGADARALNALELAPSLDAISFPTLDVDIYVPGLLRDFFGSQIFSENGRIGGKRTSPAKAAAVRANGRKGGRPKKSTKIDAA